MDAFEFFVFAQPFFDRNGFIVACDGDRIVGFSHAAVAVNDAQTSLGDTHGSLVAVVVHPDYRLNGIGRELVQHGLGYLAERGVSSVEFGATDRSNGFYIGMYGGASPCGFRLSDGPVEQFAGKMKWESTCEYRCFQKNLEAGTRDPVNKKLILNRRKTQLEAADASANASWWWMTRLGRMDSVQFNLVDRTSREALASCEIFGLDLYIPKWGQRAAGLGQIRVPEQHAGKELELTLLLEMSKYLREQLITILDTTVVSSDEWTVRLLESAGFKEQDRAMVFRLNADGQAEYEQQVVRT